MIQDSAQTGREQNTILAIFVTGEGWIGIK